MNNLVKYVQNLKLREGANDTPVSFLKLYRFTGPSVVMPETDIPYIYLVLDGCLRLHTPGGIMDYPAGQYSDLQSL